MKNQTLYFIAIIPAEPLRKQVNALKEDISQAYHTFHALKAPPHITLIPPFTITSQKEHIITNFIAECVCSWTSFEVSIMDYGAFTPKVIYLDIAKNDTLIRLQRWLKEKCAKDLGIGMDKGLPFHPHMTLAFRDLSPQMFGKAWQRYKAEKFRADFGVMSLFLLKHTGLSWEIAREFPFTQVDLPT